MNRNTSRRGSAGFTLLEVMIVMAVVGILAAIAYPSYLNSIAKTRRGAAAGCVTELGQFLERNYTLALRYDRDSANVAVTLPATQCRTDLNGVFTFATTTLTQNTYTLTATPSTSQASADKTCGCAMTLNQQGIKGVTACGKTVADCW